MRPHLMLAALSLASLVSACTQNVTPTAPAPPADPPSVSDTAVNSALHAFAQQLARSLTNVNLRQVLQQQAALRFDGDSEVLYRTLSAQQVGGNTVEAWIAGPDVGVQSTGARLQALRAVTSQVNGLQVAVRGTPWDAVNTVPLVAVAPQGGDEFAPVTAYDAAGRVYTLDAHQVPDRPVVVVGVNERTDAHGNLLGGQVTPGGVVGTQSCDSKERLKDVYLRDKHEPWTRGDPEIYVKVGTNKLGNLYTGSLASVNATGKWYGINRDLFVWNSKAVGDWLMYFWYERDGGSKVTVSFGGTYGGVTGNVSFEIEDGDDRMGNAPVVYSERLHTTSHDTGDVIWHRGACL